MEAFLISTGIVTLAEIGDKTQLLALLLTRESHLNHYFRTRQ